jgi:hypothetical protein
MEVPMACLSLNTNLAVRQIPLTQGYQVIVDAADYEWLSQWQWHVCVAAHMYAMRSKHREDGTCFHIMMHREINQTPDGLFTDHINGNSLDNRRCNLRTVTKTQNMWNRRPNLNGSSQYKGVHWHKQHGKWAACIQVNKKRYHIGLFDSETEAAMAYLLRSEKEFGVYNKELII